MTRLDTRVDMWLDKLREKSLPAMIELPLLVLSCVPVCCFYGCIFYCRQARLARQQRLAIMTMPRSRSSIPSAEVLEAILWQERGSIDDQTSSQQQHDLWLHRIQTETSLRRLVNHYMMTAPRDYATRPMYQVLDKLWPKLLELPPLLHGDDEYKYKLSLILPAFRETNQQVALRLQRSYDTCSCPDDVQIILVNAGHCSPDLRDYLAQHTSWRNDRLQSVAVDDSSSGRGPALNVGASHAAGRVLFFLHSDTLTPPNWDAQILEQFDKADAVSASGIKVHATCFQFAFDKTGLMTARKCDKSIETRPPPSYFVLLPVKWMVNIRTRFMKLPYGDQGIAMPAAYFHHIGGFSNQPIMEDYALMDYLRRRARHLPERLAVLRGSSEVSVRRWQRVGTLYMTLANALIVHRYNCQGWSPDDIFDYYYKRPYKNKMSTMTTTTPP